MIHDLRPHCWPATLFGYSMMISLKLNLEHQLQMCIGQQMYFLARPPPCPRSADVTGWPLISPYLEQKPPVLHQFHSCNRHVPPPLCLVAPTQKLQLDYHLAAQHPSCLLFPCPPCPVDMTEWPQNLVCLSQKSTMFHHPDSVQSHDPSPRCWMAKIRKLQVGRHWRHKGKYLGHPPHHGLEDHLLDHWSLHPPGMTPVYLVPVTQMPCTIHPLCPQNSHIPHFQYMMACSSKLVLQDL
mmetsp:Transcript_10929/g.19494  ORF Transcript_10929/g.19494 Transcript_10929/m.19494 type:complete len:239 (-) Transcript_10929:638-1354(-)